MRDRFGCAALAVLLIAAGGTGVEAQVSLSTYGYMSSRWEKAFDRPFVEDGRVLRDSGVAQFGQPAFDVAFKPKIGKRVRGYLSLAGDGRDVSVSKVWGEVEAHPLASVRVGPQYRRFGLYNEILHAAPTYYGVEAPELLDGDHLLIPRTTVFSLLGSMTLGAGSLEYALSVDEADVFDGAPPISWDVRYLFGGGDALIGLSGYSSGSASKPGKGGKKPAKYGMISWMKSEAYRAINVYGQAEVGSLTLQAEYARADHEAERDPGAVLEILAHGAANEGQRQRFLLDPTGPEMESNVRLVGDYVAESLYLRAGRSFRTSLGELAPYVLWDWYRNPELVADEDLGGDGEAGASDDGSFHKPTLGLVVRPIPTVAIKLDWSQHRYTLSGESVSYSELFLDVSFAFGF